MRVALGILLLATAPAFAVDAVTYKGTLGGLEIVAELAAPAPGGLVGRYSYMRQGGDIPLDTMGRLRMPVLLAEEAPCTTTTCMADDDGNVPDKPLGAIWSLAPSADGTGLTGTWEPKDKSKQLAIRLTEIGRRTLPGAAEISPYGLYDSAFRMTFGDGGPFTPATAPYEFAKMDVALEEGAIQTMDGSSFRYVTDPRSKFAFPRIVSLADGTAPDAANAALAARHALINYYAFDCLGQIYAGFGANQYAAGMGAGTLGDYDSETIVVSYLSPTVLNWVESGSTFCMGAHPDNHSNTYMLDVRTGAPLALAKVFQDWIATGNALDFEAPVDQSAAIGAPQDYVWAAGQPLIDYAIANRVPGDDSDFDAECGINELIASNLALRFVPGDAVLFTIEGLPHVNFACSQDLLTVKLRDIAALLAPTAKAYFPRLP
ncbi:hypothetical protein [uncultured Devosia sp.]|uniref:hypothetical protein n=1 Tax=uncultured Devosia sp. TaxID=211434 RepID=UPI0035C9472C